nr:NB-ARC domain-containing protein [Catenulispora pinisilvae]
MTTANRADRSTDRSNRTNHPDRSDHPDRSTDLALFLVAFVWGSSYLAAKSAAAATSVLAVLLARYALSAISGSALLAARGRLRPTRAELRTGTILGLTQASVLIIETYGVAHTSAANAGLIISLTIILTPLLDRRGAALPARYFAASGVCVVAVGLLMSGSGGLHAPSAGDLLMLAAAVVRAGHVALVGRLTSGGGGGTGFGESAAAGGNVDLERVELDPARAEEYAVAIMRRAAVDPETAREVADLLATAREAGDIPRLPVVPPVIAPPRVFVNRVAEQADLTDAAAAGVIVVAGRPGIGKTALVGKWLADLVAAKAFEVCVYLELPDRGRDVGVGDVARELLRRVGVDTSVARSDAEWVALWHSVMRGKRYCVVVDEVAQPGQVRALIPESGEGLPGGGSLLVAVGAEPLAELAGQGAEFVEVGPFDADAGVALMRRLIGDARVDAEPEAVDQVVEACDGIPAVLALAAGILGQKRDWPVAQLAALLADGERQLDVLRKRGGGRHVVDLVFDAGYAELDSDAAQAYRAMGHLERADFQPGVLAALAGLSEPATVAALETLLAKYMVTEHEWPSTGYRVGDMQRNHTREAAQRAGEFGVQARTAALRRVRDMLVATVQEADVAASPDRPLRVPEVAAGSGRFATGAEGLQWVDAHLPDLLACARSGDDDAALRIAGSVWPYVTNYRRWDDGAWLYRHAADMARRTGFAEAEARKFHTGTRALTRHRGDPRRTSASLAQWVCAPCSPGWPRRRRPNTG